MALIDLKTDLKSLKYSKDRIGGGSSQQPFVQKPIPDSFSAVGNTGGLDVLTRGGSLVFQKTADDVSRLSKLLLTGNTFQGPAFTIKQNVLSRQNVKTQASPKGLNQGVYLPTSTIAQAAISATGLHFNTFGVNPVPGTLGSLTTYSDVVSYDQPSAANRLVDLTDSFVDNRTSGNTLYSYSGGPGSILGLGKTKIQIPIEQRTGVNNDKREYWQKQKNLTKYVTLRDAQLLIPTSDKAGLTEEVTGVQYDSKFQNWTTTSTFGPSYSQELITAKFARITNTGTITAVVPNVDSTYASNNFPEVTLYKLGGVTDLNSLLGASISASLNTDFPGVSTTTNNLVTLDSLRINSFLGTKSNIELNTNSKYAKVNNLTGSLFGYGSEYDGSRSVTPLVGETPSETLGKSNPTNQTPENLQAFTYTQDQLRQAESYRTTGKIQDFRKKLRADYKDSNLGRATGAGVLAPNYLVENIENRVHLGDPGIRGDVSDYTKGKKDFNGAKIGPVDTINALPLYQSSNVAQDDEKDVNDLVKFRIAVMDSNGTSTKTFIHFRAFLDAISDNYTADWQSHKYVGRGENFYTYSGFDRKVSLGWTVYAQSREELIPMYKKLNYLASSLAPDYNNGFMRGVLVQLTIGGYLYNQPGFITSLTYELSEQSTWEIGINDAGFTEPDNRGDDYVKELPHMIKVTGFNFTPIHTFIPQVQKNNDGAFVAGDSLGNGPQRYIALDSGYDNNYNTSGTGTGNSRQQPVSSWGTEEDWNEYNRKRVATNQRIP